MNNPQVDPISFISALKWLNGQPLSEVVDLYRQKILSDALFTFEEDGRPRYNLVLTGRAKKNFKSTDLILAALYRLLIWKTTSSSNECYILANDGDQARDDLTLAKKLIAANDLLDQAVTVKRDVIERKDGNGFLEILPAGDIAGTHGKTFLFAGFDEIHGYKTWDIFEALALDPSRPDAMHWITSYASLFHRPGIPLFDLMATGKKGTDSRMFFSWYGGDYTTDEDFKDATPEVRANPSMALWNNDGYLQQQRNRLPSHKFRRLHLNLPGLPEGSAYSVDMIDAAIERGCKFRPPELPVRYFGFVDMSVGSSDDACLAIAHKDISGRAILDRVINQGPPPPFDPRTAIKKFAEVLKEYRVFSVIGDRYAGETFRQDFRKKGIEYRVSDVTKSDLYQALEPKMNAGDVLLLDIPTMESELLGLIWRGNKIDHPAGEHDDYANAVAGATYSVLNRMQATAADILSVTNPLLQEFNDFFRTGY